ncbi:flagellar filament capping protein FliD [Paenibacillus sp. SN-8-1]|uniref:flagellar filament capping protein FliD n=1 Tax=Paenibacillus sp. SN-8-1 TaxID=3435409 RepID=UPI003D9A9765
MTTMRINGFSGMDIDSMVKQLMTAKRIPLDKLNQQKTYLSWQRDSYREMNSKVFNFKSKLTDTFSLSSSMNTQTASVSGDTDAIRAEASSNTAGIAMSVAVRSVATKTTIVPTDAMMVPASTDPILPASKAKLTTALSSLDNYTAATVPADEDKPFVLTINNTRLEFSKTDTISGVISKINGSSANVNAVFDEVSGKFSITSKDFGNKDISIVEDNYGTTRTTKMMDLLKLSGVSHQLGQGSEIEVTTSSGTNVFTSDNSNTFTVNGIVLTALKESERTDPADKTTAKQLSKITTTIDPAKAVDTLKSFVQTYNDLLSLMNSKVDEEKYRDYTPLTDEQKSAMKENDITAWEAKAKSGLLKNDDILKDTITAMRSVINNKMGQLTSMGITTGQYYEGGKLYLDENKLKAALQSNPQQVTDLFQGSGSNYKDSIVGKLSTTMTSTLQKFSDRAGTNRFSGDLSSAFKDESVMGKAMKDYTSRITAMTTRLNDAETRYYQQFSAMESAMSKLQSQSSSLLGSTSN